MRISRNYKVEDWKQLSFKGQADWVKGLSRIRARILGTQQSQLVCQGRGRIRWFWSQPVFPCYKFSSAMRARNLLGVHPACAREPDIKSAAHTFAAIAVFVTTPITLK